MHQGWEVPRSKRESTNRPDLGSAELLPQRVLLQEEYEVPVVQRQGHPVQQR